MSKQEILGRCLLHTQIEDYTFEYEVLISVHGEVIDMQNLFFQLSENAQKLTLGRAFDTIIPRLKKYEKLYKYKIPLYFIGYLEVEELTELRECRDKLELSTDSYKKIKDPWTKELYKTYALFVQKNIKTADTVLRNLAKVLNIEKDPFMAITWLAYKDYPLVAPVIKDYIPTLASNQTSTLGDAYALFRLFPSPEIKNFLLDQLKKEKHERVVNGIFSGLSAYNDSDVYETVLNYYKKHQSTKKSESAGALRVLANFKTDKVKEIGWDLLLSPHKAMIESAIPLLKAQDISEKKIVKPLLKNLMEEKEIAHITNILHGFQKIKNQYLLPRAKDLFIVLNRVVEIPEHRMRTELFSSLIRRGYDSNVPAQLMNMFNSDHAYIRNIGLLSIILLYDDFDIFKFQPSKLMINRIIELLDDDTKEVEISAVSCLSIVASKNNTIDILPFLLKKAETGSLEVKNYAMGAINKQLQNNKFDDRITSLYTEYLYHPNEGIRKKAIDGLKTSPSEGIKNKINVLVNNSEKDKEEDEELEGEDLREKDEFIALLRVMMNKNKTERRKEFSFFRKIGNYIKANFIK